MKLWIVFVTFKVNSVSGSHYNVRYVDSQWASEEHARDRKSELEDSLTMGKVTDYVVQLMAGKVADAAIADVPSDTPALPSPNTKTPGEPDAG